MSIVVVTVKLAYVDPELWLATAHWHGLRWKAVGDTPEEAMGRARAVAETGVWNGEPMVEAAGYVP